MSTPLTGTNNQTHIFPPGAKLKSVEISDELTSETSDDPKHESFLIDTASGFGELEQQNMRLNERIAFLESCLHEYRMRDNREYQYAIRIHDRESDDDLLMATVMYSKSGNEGPWYDMVYGNLDWCWEVLDALERVAMIKAEEKEKERVRFAEEIASMKKQH
jgi:hypothetical protein